jgi:TnpA family transposase
LETITFGGVDTAQPVLDALAFLHSLERRGSKGTGRMPGMREAPIRVVSQAWRRLVLLPDGNVDRRHYTFCAVEQLQKALRRRDIFVSPSRRWSNPRTKLLEGADWEAVRPQLCRSLGRSTRPEEELYRMRTQLDEAYRRTGENLEENVAVRIEQKKGRDRLVLSPLDKLDESPSLLRLRDQVDALMPRVDLPEVLLEVQAWTGFADAFTHVSEGRARAEGLSTSVCAALVAEACNIGTRPLVQSGTSALSPARLSWVLQNYIRAETLTAANACLVDYQATIPLVEVWGGGEVASADGLRFVVPVQTTNAGPNPKYFNVGRGVTYYNFTSDQFTGFHAIVIPGTIRDSLYILSGLLEHETRLEPIEVVADTAAYSDVVFGLFWLLGYQFSPRLADIGDTRFWRIDPGADYGLLNGIARNRIDTGLIKRNWDDLLRVAGSLKTGTVGAHEIMRLLTRGGGSSRAVSTLARAVGEVGRV